MSKRNKRYFTAEEIQLLKANKNTARISSDRIFFTEEFSEKALAMYLEGYNASSILVLADYDIKILGQKRVSSLAFRLRKKSKLIPQERAVEGTDTKTSDKSYESLKAENAVLKQQLEFLKKVISVKTGKDSEQ